uniref:Uncharacterized protein n=1 Tax=Haptolina brevifila TaxID=156173 RepID=A0A7S2GKR8_9EUKA
MAAAGMHPMGGCMAAAGMQPYCMPARLMLNGIVGNRRQQRSSSSRRANRLARESGCTEPSTVTTTTSTTTSSTSEPAATPTWSTADLRDKLGDDYNPASAAAEAAAAVGVAHAAMAAVASSSAAHGAAGDEDADGEAEPLPSEPVSLNEELLSIEQKDSVSAAASVALRKAVNILIDHGRHEAVTWEANNQLEAPAFSNAMGGAGEGHASVTETAQNGAALNGGSPSTLLLSSELATNGIQAMTAVGTVPAPVVPKKEVHGLPLGRRPRSSRRRQRTPHAHPHSRPRSSRRRSRR